MFRGLLLAKIRPHYACTRVDATHKTFDVLSSYVDWSLEAGTQIEAIPSYLGEPRCTEPAQHGYSNFESHKGTLTCHGERKDCGDNGECAVCVSSQKQVARLILSILVICV